jgi:hypothetical protein
MPRIDTVGVDELTNDEEEENNHERCHPATPFESFLTEIPTRKRLGNIPLQLFAPGLPMPPPAQPACRRPPRPRRRTAHPDDVQEHVQASTKSPFSRSSIRFKRRIA